jgi:hypothetical protein
MSGQSGDSRLTRGTTRRMRSACEGPQIPEPSYHLVALDRSIHSSQTANSVGASVRLAESVRQGPDRHGCEGRKPTASKDASASRWLFRWLVAVRVGQAGRGLAAQRPRSVPRLMLCSSSIRRRRVRSDWRSSSRSRAASIRAWSPSEATWGRTPWPSGSRLAARRMSS